MTTSQRLHTLLRLLPVLVAGITLAILYLHYHQVAKLKRSAFESLVLETQQQARTPFKRLFDPVTTTLKIAVHWLHNDMPDPADTRALNARLMPVLREVAQISSTMIANSDGQEYMLLRTEDGWLTRTSDAGQADARVQWRRWSGPDTAVENWKETLEYDPRARPWFRGAVDSGGTHPVFWTPAYRFFTTRELGITAASRVAFPDRDDKFTVIAFDVRLTDISALTRQLLDDTRGKAFVVGGNGQVLAVPAEAGLETTPTEETLELTPADTFPDAVVRTAYNTWQSLGRPGNTPFEFSVDRTGWWASLWQYPLANRTLWLAVTVPEAELVARVGGTNYAVPGIVTGAGLLLFVASLAAIRKYRPDTTAGDAAPGPVTRFMQQLDDRNDTLAAALLQLIHSGENEQLEFKASVRWNFKAGRTGKEMELAWLKTVVAFLNSKGGIILLGVADDGEILGLNNDGFSNDDKALRHIENLIAQHLGPAHFPRIHSRLVRVDDAQVMIIACETSRKPVFLKHDKGEDFYIRTGPASRALATSDALTYIESRKQK